MALSKKIPVYTVVTSTTYKLPVVDYAVAYRVPPIYCVTDDAFPKPGPFHRKPKLRNRK